MEEAGIILLVFEIIFFFFPFFFASNEKFRVIHTYKANSNSELSIDIGEIVGLISMDDEEWWEGEINGKSGFFPKLYVQLIKEKNPNEPTSKQGFAV